MMDLITISQSPACRTPRDFQHHYSSHEGVLVARSTKVCDNLLSCSKRWALESQRTKGTAEEQMRLILKSEIAIY